MDATGDGFRHRTATLRAGRIHYREAGEGPAVVFVHGFGVNGTLWDPVAGRIAPHARCILPDWPLGSHPEAMRADADLSPAGVARLISEFLAALDLDDVTVVGNDSGGAVCQILVTEHPERIGGLVLTNCDCFENFPPAEFKAMVTLMKVPGFAALLANSLRIRAVRRSRRVYGALTEKPLDDGLLLGWTRPQVADRGVRRDAARFGAQADNRLTIRAAERMPELDIPALLVWGTADPFFPVAHARRLAELIPDSRLVELPGARTFVSLDRPGEVAREVAAFVGRRAPAAAQSPGQPAGGS
jgi:pimeloyl-ACP methyl ester carboxylesterase